MSDEGEFWAVTRMRGYMTPTCQVFIVIVIIINPIIAVVVVWMGLLEFQLAPVIS